MIPAVKGIALLNYVRFGNSFAIRADPQKRTNSCASL